MKALIKYAGPLMMLGFPTLIFAADTLRQLNAKPRGMMSSYMMQRGINLGAICNSESVGIAAIGDVYQSEERLYRCVIIFDERYQPAGSAWVEVSRAETQQESEGAVVFREQVALHN